LPIPDYIGRKLVTTGSPNYTGWRDPEVDRLYAAAVSSTDETVRAQSFTRVQELFHGDSGNLVWGSGDWTAAVAADVRGVDAALPNTARWGRFDRAVRV
jgi:peptide/nickel transport system substrate-binding protein